MYWIALGFERELVDRRINRYGAGETAFQAVRVH